MVFQETLGGCLLAKKPYVKPAIGFKNFKLRLYNFAIH